MGIFLKILGGLALVAIVLVAALLFFFWWKLRSIAKELSTASGETPSTIDLEPDANPEWLAADEVKRDLAELAACGYVTGPAYTVVGMIGVNLVSLEHPATGAYGAYYQHPAVGHWTDLCLDLADGLEVSISNATMGHQMDTRPDTKKSWLPGKPAAERHAALIAHATGQAVKPVVLADFKAAFINAYAKDMAWRNAKGGVSPEEFNRIAENKDLTAEQRAEAFKQSKFQEICRWSGEALEQFSKVTTLSVAEWKEYENNIIIFHESFHGPAFLSYLDTFLSLESDDEVAYYNYATAVAGSLSVTELLERISRDRGHQFVKLGEVSQPRPLTIYGIKYPPEADSSEE